MLPLPLYFVQKTAILTLVFEWRLLPVQCVEKNGNISFSDPQIL